MNDQAKLTRCEEVGPLLVFYTCDELSAGERAQIDAHLAKCDGCRAQLSEEAALQSAFDRMPQSADQIDASGTLLAQCRSELSESLDELAAPKADEGWRPFALVREWMALRPGWSAAALLLVGAIVGTQVLQWVPWTFGAGNGAGAAVSVLAAPKILDLDKVAVSNVNFSRQTGKVQLQLQAEQPMTLSSDDDAADVRRVMNFVITNGDRFNAGIRIDCVEALRNAANHDEQTRTALLAAARKDQNPAVRLKALDALRDLAGLSSVRDVLLGALKDDPNPGVRVEAVNLLVRSLESVDDTPEPSEANDSDLPAIAATGVAPQALPATSRNAEQRILLALDELRQHDSNRYVRLRSAAALRQIAQQELQ
ncbi:MAG: HEAT repeat domain-containing protein [Acidobacteria bacterium]|nr:HEAT repeat domain-containing protein [Acidobacteriota bacterium]MBS1864620.1 HEAT repeat domain-containing protein [Acidobacteriota bacterium]